ESVLTVQPLHASTKFMGSARSIVGLVLMGLSAVPAACPLAWGADAAAPAKALAAHDASTSKGDAAGPQEVFKAKGLNKVGFFLVSVKETELRTAAGAVRSLKVKLTNEAASRTGMERAIKTASATLINMQSQLVTA